MPLSATATSVFPSGMKTRRPSMAYICVCMSSYQGHLFVNGKLISKGGSFKDRAISYYVKPDLIKADDQVTMNFYDGSGNLLAENQTVSVN